MSRLHPSMLLLVASLVLLVVSTSCAGEASVAYEGAVVESTEAGHHFDETPNPEGLPPVEGAAISFCICLDGCEGDCGDSRGTDYTTDAEGRFEIPDAVFGGSFFGDQHIEIKVTKDGYDPYTYHTVYETTSDPTNGEEYLTIELQPSQED